METAAPPYRRVFLGGSFATKDAADAHAERDFAEFTADDLANLEQSIREREP
jgi:hypothetical protein